MSVESGGGARARPPRPIGADLIIPVMALIFAAYFFSDIFALSWEAKANGIVIGSILIGLCILQIIMTLMKISRGEGTLSPVAVFNPPHARTARLGLVAMLAAFILLLPVTGTTLGLMGLMTGSMLLLGVRDKRWLAGLSVGVAAFVYVMFILVLNARLPHGPVEMLIDVLRGGA